MPSIVDIHRTAYHARPPEWESRRHCGEINTHLRDIINGTFGLICDLSVGEIAAAAQSRVGAGHAWVYVPADHVEEETAVIVDGALDQFSVENKDRELSAVGLLPENEFPPRVCIITEVESYTAPCLQGTFDHFIEHDRDGPLQSPS